VAYAIASSARNLAVGSGTVSITSASPTLTFSAAQSFKKGATVIVDYAGTPYLFTIVEGSGTTWLAAQAATGTAATKAFKTTDTGTGRGRGTDGAIIPGAKHYLYRSVLDNASAADWYTYFDTIQPEKGLHPFSGDVWTGASMIAPALVQQGVPDVGTRIRVLEGILRQVPGGTDGDLNNPDAGLDAIVARLYQLEAWAIRVGTNSPPAQGSQAAAVYADFLAAGDAA
jgi:hypothetical protein